MAVGKRRSKLQTYHNPHIHEYELVKMRHIQAYSTCTALHMYKHANACKPGVKVPLCPVITNTNREKAANMRTLLRL
jgi:hypothetical protein